MLAFLVAAVIASSSPGITYLDCTAMQRGEPVRYTITLNEPAGVAIWSGASARRQDRAQFTADAVYFQTFKIDRASLSMVRQYPNVMEDGVETEIGQCRIAPQVKRAF